MCFSLLQLKALIFDVSLIPLRTYSAFFIHLLLIFSIILSYSAYSTPIKIDCMLNHRLQFLLLLFACFQKFIQEFILSFKCFFIGPSTQSFFILYSHFSIIFVLFIDYSLSFLTNSKLFLCFILNFLLILIFSIIFLASLILSIIFLTSLIFSIIFLTSLIFSIIFLLDFIAVSYLLTFLTFFLLSMTFSFIVFILAFFLIFTFFLTFVIFFDWLTLLHRSQTQNQ